MKKIILLVWIFLLSLSQPALATQCSSYEGSTPPDAKAKFFSSDYTFAGSVTDIKTIREKIPAKKIRNEDGSVSWVHTSGGKRTKVITFKPSKIFKGRKQDEVKLYLTSGTSGSIYYNFVIDQEYLIFAKNHSGKLVLGSSICSYNNE